MPRSDVSRWESTFLNFIQERKPDLHAALEREKKMTEQIESDLKGAIAEFKEKHFR